MHHCMYATSGQGTAKMKLVLKFTSAWPDLLWSYQLVPYLYYFSPYPSPCNSFLSAIG